MLPPQTSLVKYNSPILVNTTKERTLKGKKQQQNGASSKSNQPAEVIKPTVFTGSHTQSTSQTEDILNSILPPKEWTEDAQLWVQYVSSTPATRLDVVNLQVDKRCLVNVACWMGAHSATPPLPSSRSNWICGSSSARRVRRAFALFEKSSMRSALVRARCLIEPLAIE